MTRRELLMLFGGGSLAGVAARFSFAQPAPASAFVPDVELTLRAAPGEARILSGPATRVWRFTGDVLKGPRESMQVLPDSYLGPVLRFRKGQKVRIRYSNGLTEPSIVHWHGLDTPWPMDGHPHSVIDPQQQYVYEFEVTNRAGTYWYHPHPHARTGPQVYHGLAGLLLVSDDEEATLKLPNGADELLCVLQDRTFDEENQLIYVSGMHMDQVQGFLGEKPLVNGIERPSFALATKAYRVRLLNGSSARIYKLGWSDDTPMTVIGVDGGLLERPVQQRYVTLAPGPRADVILDLSGREPGTSIELRSAPFSQEAVDSMGMRGMGMGMGRGMGGMGRGMGGGMGMRAAALPNGSLLSLLTINVDRREPSSFRLPDRLSTFDPSWDAPPTHPTRLVTLDFRQGEWLLDGRTFDMHDADPDETFPAGSSQIWEIVNTPGMMAMHHMAHPIHLHGPQFRILSRQGYSTAGAVVAEGFVDAGWTDTVLVMPGETVRIKARFTRHPGLYLYHCHILEHEDMGMMRNFRVT